MRQYIIKKQFILNSKTFYRDKLLTSDDIEVENAKRLITAGYIKLIGDINTHKVEDTSLSDPFLSAGEIEKLKKPELIDYATKIGILEVDPSTSANELKNLINQFIQGKESGE